MGVTGGADRYPIGRAKIVAALMCYVRFDGGSWIEADLHLAKEARAKEGRNFDAKRFFSDDDELLLFGGRTYAFSSQWGGSDWMQAMINLRDAFPDQEIEFEPSE